MCGLLNYYVSQLCKGTSERCEKRQCLTGFWRKCNQWFRNINWKTRIEQYRRLQNIMLHTCATSTPAKYIPMVRSILTIQMTKDSGPTLPLNTMYGLKFGPNLQLYIMYGNRKSVDGKSSATLPSTVFGASRPAGYLLLLSLGVRPAAWVGLSWWLAVSERINNAKICSNKILCQNCWRKNPMRENLGCGEFVWFKGNTLI